MRLINVETWTIEEHLVQGPSDGPIYAILSHTWEDEEVTLQEFQSCDRHELQDRASYKKIEETGREARSRGIPYVWVDTCCIDKTSSAELSEAINSMYNWYALAEVCFAFLADVTFAGRHNYDRHQPKTASDIEREFRPSRWFTRGWTLQELIAPCCVLFFDANWTYVGDRGQLAGILASITKIDRTLLQDGAHTSVQGGISLSQFSVACRLSWASGRKTTRLEDEAYCLLGLLEINMPLLYGERNRAFQRLQEEIIRTSTDQSIFAWESDSLSDGCILAPDVTAFRGCGNIVRLPEHIFRDKSYELGNRGLQISLPLVRPLPSECCSAYAVLNCRQQHDYLSVIALNLHNPIPGVTMDVFTPIPNKLYHGSPSTTRAQDHRRISVVDFDAARAAQRESIVITQGFWDGYKSESQLSGEGHDRMLVKIGEQQERRRIKLAEVIPRTGSNTSTGYVALWNLGNQTAEHTDRVGACLFDLGADSKLFAVLTRVSSSSARSGRQHTLELVNAGFVTRNGFENIRIPEDILYFDQLDNRRLRRNNFHSRGVMARVPFKNGQLAALLMRQYLMGEVVTMLEVGMIDKPMPTGDRSSGLRAITLGPSDFEEHPRGGVLSHQRKLH